MIDKGHLVGVIETILVIGVSQGLQGVDDRDDPVNLNQIFRVVRERRLELLPLSGLDPKSSASASSATLARPCSRKILPLMTVSLQGLSSV